MYKLWYSIPQNNTLRIYPKAGPDRTHVYLSHTSIWVPLQMRPPPPPPSSPASVGTNTKRQKVYTGQSQSQTNALIV